MRACSSGVSFGVRRSGSRAGSPGGSDPSGSRCAARWPCIRIALTSAIEAAIPPRSSLSAATGAGAAGGGGCGAATGGVAWPSPSAASSSKRTRPGWLRKRASGSLSNRWRHSSGTALGLSRYCSRSSAAYPVFSPSTSGRPITTPVVAGALRLPEGMARGHRHREPEEEADGADHHRRKRKLLALAGHPRRDQGDRGRREDQPQRVPRDPDQAHEDRDRGEVTGDRLR